MSLPVKNPIQVTRILLNETVMPWKDVEKDLYLLSYNDVRGVYSEKNIPSGIIVTVYPHSNELSKREWNQLQDEDIQNRCSSYVVERTVPKRNNKPRGKYVLCPNEDTKPPPFGHLLNHCRKHPNLQMIKCYPGPQEGDYYCGFLSLREIKAGEQLVWNYGDMCELAIRHQCPPNCPSLKRPTMTEVPIGKTSQLHHSCVLVNRLNERDDDEQGDGKEDDVGDDEPMPDDDDDDDDDESSSDGQQIIRPHRRRHREICRAGDATKCPKCRKYITQKNLKRHLTRLHKLTNSTAIQLVRRKRGSTMLSGKRKPYYCSPCNKMIVRISAHKCCKNKHYIQKAYLRASKDAGVFLANILGTRDTKLMTIRGNNKTRAQEIWRNMYLHAGGR